MRGVNRITLIGNAGQDPDIRHTPGGDAVATFSLAVGKSWKGQDGQKQERTTWFRIVAWRQLAEIVEQYVRKGNPLYVEGEMLSRDWTDQQGVKKTSWEVTAATINLLGGNGEAPQQQVAPRLREAPQQHEATVATTPAAAAPLATSSGADDDIPF